MRILVLGDVPPYVVGGAEMQTWRLAQQWTALGHQVEVAGHRIPREMRQGIVLHHLPIFRHSGRAVRGASYFLSLTYFLVRRKSQFDVIYCRFLGEAALSVAFLKQVSLVDLPLVAVPAAGGNEDKADVALLRSLPGTDRLISLLNRECDCINFIAPGVETSLRSAGIHPRRAACIPNGVPRSQYRAKGPGNQVNRLLFVGRLVYQKGLDLLFPVLQRLQRAGVDFHLTLIGDGPLRRELERLARHLELSQRLTFLGSQPQDVVAQEMAKAHLFILPSRYEGLSNAALEALSCGLPCLLSRCGGLDSFLTDKTGWVFDPAKPEEMEAALMSALQMKPEQWRVMSKASQALVQEHFAMESIARSYSELFESLLRLPSAASTDLGSSNA